MAHHTYAGLSKGFSTHAAPRAKNVIFCFMAGGVSHVDTFDPKPALAKQHGKPIGQLKDTKHTQIDGNQKWKQSPWTFEQYGQCQMAASELFPHLAGCVDQMALVRSMVAKSLGNHDGIESAICNYEMAYRMQTEIPDVLDLSRESIATLNLYGVNAEDEQLRLYTTQCLRARTGPSCGRFLRLAGRQGHSGRNYVRGH